MNCTRKWSAENLKDIDTLIFDCDGVLWRGEDPIPGAIQTLETLRAMDKNILFLTNNSTKSRETYLKRFTHLGIKAEVKEIFTSALASALYLKQHHPALSKVLTIGGKGIGTELRDQGFHAVELSSTLAGKHCSRAEMDAWEIDSDIDAVVIGLDFELSYSKIAYAELVLRSNPEIVFVCTNRDLTFPVARGRLLPGAGMGVHALEACAGREAVNVGKPGTLLFESMDFVHGLCKERTLMVGDRLDTDIMFGRNAGIGTMLVLSGVTTLEILESCDECIPDYCIPSIASLL